MTREEAIQILADLIDSPFLHTWEKQNKALHMAIEALSDDTVSREAHYDAVANRITDMEERGFVSVVRCKDCKYSFYDKDYESYNCRKHEYVELFDADDYCSWGERND